MRHGRRVRRIRTRAKDLAAARTAVRPWNLRMPRTGRIGRIAVVAAPAEGREILRSAPCFRVVAGAVKRLAQNDRRYPDSAEIAPVEKTEAARVSIPAPPSLFARYSLFPIPYSLFPVS